MYTDVELNEIDDRVRAVESISENIEGGHSLIRTILKLTAEIRRLQKELERLDGEIDLVEGTGFYDELGDSPENADI